MRDLLRLPKPLAPARGARRHHVLLAVVAGGAVGAPARAIVETHLAHDVGAWPWATLSVNVAGTLLLGWWSTRLPRSTDIDPRLHPFLATGICGGLTTFSTMQLELLEMLDRRALGLAVAYLAASVLAGAASILAGRAAAHYVHCRNR